MTDPLFQRIAIIGIGLIGSSLARAIAEQKLAGEIAIFDASAEARAAAHELTLGQVVDSLAAAAKDADLVILATPIGAYADIGPALAPHLKKGAILTDVGSVKQAVIRDLGPHVPEGVHFIPGHPIAGTEHSGPRAGFADLFKGRWAIVTPVPGSDPTATAKLQALWSAVGSMVEVMEPAHHDQVLAITSHLPHLIAYTIVDTATQLETSTQSEVIKFSASGFRDFTRIAASDPTMWRDIFLNNREAVLEILGRFTEDLTAMQRAIRWGEGDKLFETFTRTRAVRRGIIDAKQA
ncbi:prephenate/arogenate dehydrogenase family protein [Dongia rigui]|uniref:Prephenate/arogenate dehydrogenase family protein n=1 Tax=Dongia rigui TaxID=940149 RepID=A0ABU5DWE1_9PROT|nr:prephenate/arogenate dehydrogenase family protein [Dongia rigui]MDY0871264.1 prephenate/arogenate dehydrogenase family protein [Dongia rigui]